MDKKICIISLFMTFACISCEKISHDECSQAKGVYLNIRESVLKTETKTNTSDFSAGSTFGLFICRHTDQTPNPYIEHAPRYNNIRAERTKTNWLYNYSGYSKFPTLFIVEKKDDLDKPILADIFAYAPHQENQENLENIPFSLEKQPDMMYAIENKDLSQNKQINPAVAGNEITIPLTFAHVLSLLEFNITLKNEDYNHPDGNNPGLGYKLHSIKVQKGNTEASSGTPLYYKGAMNAITGNLHSLESVESFSLHSQYLRVTYPEKYNHQIISYMYLIPAEPADDDYVFSFTFEGELGESPITLPSKFYLKKEHLKHGSSDTYGFKPGFKYTFNFVIDNYIHLNSVEFGEWTTIDTPIYEIHI